MAEENFDQLDAGLESAAIAKDDPTPKTALIVPAVNSGFLLISLAFLIYSKLIYKHPIITDAGEKARILALSDAPSDDSEEIGSVPFGPLAINILPSPDNTVPSSPNSPPVKGKMHYLSVAFTLEIRDKSQIPLVKSLKPFILDKLIQLAGKKPFHELATVQGRYILHTQLMEVANQTIFSRTQIPDKNRLITNLYFTTFLVQ